MSFFSSRYLYWRALAIHIMCMLRLLNAENMLTITISAFLTDSCDKIWHTLTQIPELNCRPKQCKKYRVMSISGFAQSRKRSLPFWPVRLSLWPLVASIFGLQPFSFFLSSLWFFLSVGAGNLWNKTPNSCLVRWLKDGLLFLKHLMVSVPLRPCAWKIKSWLAIEISTKKQMPFSEKPLQLRLSLPVGFETF